MSLIQSIKLTLAMLLGAAFWAALFYGLGALLATLTVIN